MARKHLKLKTSVKVTFMCLVMLSLLTMTILLTFSLKKTKQSDSITYNNTGSLTPSICLVTNEFLPSTCSTEQKSYVTSLIDKMTVNFKLNLNASDTLTSSSYNYKIEANVKANEKGDSAKVVYNNIEVLDSGTLTKDSGQGFNVNKDFNVDFKKYNDIITSFKKNYVLALDSNLIITATISEAAIYDKVNIPYKSEKTISLVVPLSEQTVNIDYANSKFKEDITNNSDVKSSEYTSVLKKLNILYRADIIFVLFMIYFAFRLMPKQSAYTKKVRKILKEYDQAIAITKNFPILKDFKVIQISSFEELIDVKDNLGKPILFFENRYHNCARFLILNDNEAYIFTIRAFENDD